MFRACFRCLPLLALLVSARAAEPLQRFDRCTLVPAEWADGDSFPIRTADKREFTVRLYGADCMEWHVTDDTDARRLRSQRRWFGIAEITGARRMGEAAAERVRAALAKPFTVHTAFADARGDGKHKRFYAFVTAADGRDLASLLVSEGLARAFGVYRTGPDGASHAEYRERLRDLELQAAKHGRGAWALTDWEMLPEERRLDRLEEAELEEARSGRPPDPLEPLDPNTAARDDLMRIPGIGEELANRIIENRPYRSLEDLDRVSGIGPRTLEKLADYLRVRELPPGPSRTPRSP